MVVPSATYGFNTCQTTHTHWVVVTSTTIAITSANNLQLGGNNICYHGINISQHNLQLGGNNISYHGNKINQLLLEYIVVCTIYHINKLAIASATLFNIKLQQLTCVVLPSHTHNGNNICQKCGYKICHRYLDKNICQGYKIKNRKNWLNICYKIN